MTDEPADPIKEIKVEVTAGSGRNGPKTIYTDENGEYKYSDNYAWPDPEYIITFTNADGEENGGDFETAEEKVKILYSDLEVGRGWYEGEARKTLDVTLREKEPEEEPSGI